jgi:hypothetical protein
LLRGRDKGTVAVTFLLSLPILLFIVAIFVQYALIVNAKLVVQRAAMAAARTAMTALPLDPDVDGIEGDIMVRRSAYMALAPLSPMAGSASADGEMLGDSLERLGMLQGKGGASFGRRYTYAENGATVEWERIGDDGAALPDAAWEPADYARARGQQIRLTVTYPFLLTVPAVNKLIGAEIGTGKGTGSGAGGVTGRVLTLTATRVVTLSHGREAAANGNGWPQ